MVGLEVSIVTVRDIFQDEAGRHSRFSEEYRSKSAVIILDRQDLGSLGAKEGDLIVVGNDTGSVVVARVWVMLISVKRFTVPEAPTESHSTVSFG